jgi:hypothetical protein
MFVNVESSLLKMITELFVIASVSATDFFKENVNCGSLTAEVHV